MIGNFCKSLNFKRNLEIRLISVVKKYIYIYSFYFNPRCSFCGTNTSKDFECEPQIYNILDVIKNWLIHYITVVSKL